MQGLGATALWTAACRAEESAREEPLSHDPFARALCGEEGLRIGRAMEAEGRAHDAIVIRTRVIDERIEQAFRQGCSTVLTLGAGLDARPYRMSREGVRWVEVDRPEVLQWKAERLPPTAPPVERRALDLRDLGAISALLDSLRCEELLVVMEGVLVYLPPDRAEALLSLLAARRGLRLLCDLGGGAWSKFFGRRPAEVAARSGAPYRTQAQRPSRWLSSLGFRVIADISLVDWDGASPHPRWSHSLWQRLVPGLRDAARVLDVVASQASHTTVTPSPPSLGLPDRRRAT